MVKQQNRRLDEEQQVLYLRDVVVQRRQIIERQIAMYGPLNMPPHLQIELDYQDDELARLDKRLSNARRKKKREQVVLHVVNTASGITRFLVPIKCKPRRRSKGWRAHAHLWLARIGMIAVLCASGLVMFWWQNLMQPRSQTAVNASEIVATSVSFVSPEITIGDRRVVGNTGGLGVRFRNEPRQDALSNTNIADGVIVYAVESLTDPNGELWWRVKLDDGSIGYIKDKYLSRM